MNIINVKLEDLKPYENNPRVNDNSVEPVAKSIKEFGFKVPIIIDKNNIIVAGHTRYKAAKKLNLSEVPCIVADDLTDEQIKAFRLADNKVGENSLWDYDLLDLELDGIADIDMEDFGFIKKTFDDIIIPSANEDDEEESEPVIESKKKLHKCPECGCEFED